MGWNFANRLTPNSDITASSQFGVNGIVEINDFNSNPNSALFELPTNLQKLSDQIVKGCGAYGGENRFTAVGRGGLPTDAGAELTWWWILQDFGRIPSAQDEVNIMPDRTRQPSPSTQPEVDIGSAQRLSRYREATEIGVTSTGKVQLMTAHQWILAPFLNCVIQSSLSQH